MRLLSDSLALSLIMAGRRGRSPYPGDVPLPDHLLSHEPEPTYSVRFDEFHFMNDSALMERAEEITGIASPRNRRERRKLTADLRKGFLP